MKYGVVVIGINQTLSPPSRAAWIEMSKFFNRVASTVVAAFTGGVD